MNEGIDKYLKQYYPKFLERINKKQQVEKEHDLLMDVFGVTQMQKKEDAQYWGRQLGALWQKVVTSVFQNSDNVKGFTGPIVVPDSRGKTDEPADLSGNGYAIDTKYRIGSGDSKFNKQFKTNASILVSKGFKPVLLILRTDSLSNAIRAAKNGGWVVYSGESAFDFIKKQTNFDLKSYLEASKLKYDINKK